MIANVFYGSSMVFFTRYVLKLSDNITSVILIVSIIVNIIYTPILKFAALKYDKKM